MTFISYTINSTWFNLTIDTSSTYFYVNTTTFPSNIDLFTVTDGTPVPVNATGYGLI